MIYRVVFIFFFSCAHQALGQTQGLPVQFGQFFNGYSIINPAMSGSRSDVEIELGKQRHTDVFSIYSTTYASGFFRVRRKPNSSSFHVPGLSFISDKEGQLLKRSKVYLTYAWHTQLNKKLSLSAGAAAGMFSYQVASSNASAGGGANAPDASIGLWLYNKTFFAGASFNQILNTSLTPIAVEQKLIRHFNVTGGYTYHVSKSFKFTPIALLRITPELGTLDMDIAAVGSLNNILLLGINYRYERNFLGMVGFERLNIGVGSLRAGFSYAVPVGRIASLAHTYELTLNYAYTKQKKKTPQ
jgi:type IX secretion system PorP/SprF family membrane protein